MLEEVVKVLRPRDGQSYIDATFGAGGYSREILETADCRVLALDRDPSAVMAGQGMKKDFEPRLELLLSPFGNLLDWTHNPHTAPDYESSFDGVVFDLGVSSMQLDQPQRGFSFLGDGPLDMRMFKAADTPNLEEGHSAEEVINDYDEGQLADIIFQLGEENRSRVIDRAIVSRRAIKPFERTLDLAQVIEEAVGGRRGVRIHPATKTFQALRMFVNDELGQLVKALTGAEHCLKPGGRLVVVTFHSLEDRIVKRFIAQRSGKKAGVSRHMPNVAHDTRAPSFQIVNQRSLTSSKGEIQVNPRARSARLRSGERLGTPAFPIDFSNLGVPAIAQEA